MRQRLFIILIESQLLKFYKTSTNYHFSQLQLEMLFGWPLFDFQRNFNLSKRLQSAKKRHSKIEHPETQGSRIAVDMVSRRFRSSY